MIDSTMQIVRYTPTWRKEWDEFVEKSRNGVFLFYRNYMEYHSHIFRDHSLLFIDPKGHIRAVLPANESDGVLYTHQGLTFGGLVLDAKSGTNEVLSMFESLREYSLTHGLQEFVYKRVPYIYTSAPSEEDRYALSLMGAQLSHLSVTPSLCPSHSLAWQTRRIRGRKKAQKSNIICHENADFSEYWKVLESVLAETHEAKPVHSIEEILLLHSRFPANIHLHVATHSDEIVAGVVIFESTMVAKTQYIASNSIGKKNGALDLLFYHCINDWYYNKAYFDFGTCETPDGSINHGLLDQKEGFGARAVLLEQYKLHW